MSTFATIVIGALGLWIAYQQWRTAHSKFKLDLFDRRYAVFAATAHLVAMSAQDGNVTIEGLTEFRQKTAEAEFLFGKEIVDFLNEIVSHAMVSMQHGPKKFQSIRWSQNTFTNGVLQAKFAPYLNLFDRL